MDQIRYEYTTQNTKGINNRRETKKEEKIDR